MHPGPAKTDSVASLVHATAALLVARGETLGVAESSTGGLIGHLLTDQPGASGWFVGGVIAYHNRVKSELLGVPAALFSGRDAASGTVSAATARALALGAQQRLKCDWAIAETGLAGTHGGRSAKPIGLAYVAIAGPGDGIQEQHRLWDEKHEFQGDRKNNKAEAAKATIHLLYRILVQDLC